MLGTFFKDILQGVAPTNLRKSLRPSMGLLLVSGFVANIITVLTSLFTLLVYDKVYPHNSSATLLVMTLGVAVLLVVDITIRVLRGRVINHALFGTESVEIPDAIRQRFTIYSKESGKRPVAGYLKAAIEKLNDLKPADIRTATLMVDLPFIFLLLLVIYIIAGHLVWIAISAIAFLLIFTGVSHQKYQTLSLKHEDVRRQAIEQSSQFARGAEWFFGLNAWRWFAQKDADLRGSVSEKAAMLAGLSSTRQVVYQSVTQIVSISVVVFGFFFYQTGDITFGQIIATTLLTSRCLSPIGSIAQVLTTKRDITEQEQQSSVSLGTLRPPDVDWSISFKEAKFTYPAKQKEALAIDAVAINAGERVAILGRSGSGKSTFAKALCRMVQVSSGELVINGIPLSKMNDDAWGQFCTYVPQTPWMLNGSLFDQIKLGEDSVTDNVIAEKMAELNLQDVFEQLDIKDGIGFSAGQLQLLGLLRCLTRQTPFLILDEPTNFLDEETETRVMQAILQQYASSTILLITHRMSLLKFMHRGLVFDEGKIVRDSKITEIKS